MATSSQPLIKNTSTVLPEEIVVDIISRVPVKPVFQLQCLSRIFSSITNDPYFVDAHLKHSGHLRPSIILNNGQNIYLVQSNRRSSEIRVKELPFHKSIVSTKCKSKKEFRMVGSCNGLVIFSVDDHNYFIWNPATIQCNQIPNPSNSGDGSILSTTWGFGYCTESKQYKIVRIAHYIYQCNFIMEAEVLSYGTDCEWRRLDVGQLDLYITDVFGITVNGVVYWDSIDHECPDNKLLTFDLVKEEFGWIYCPRKEHKRIMEFMGSLAMCVESDGGNSYDLWVLKDAVNEDSWEKVCTIDEMLSFLPACFLNDYQLLLLERKRKRKYRYSCFLCDLECKKIMEIPQLLVRCRSEVRNFVESMVPL